MEPQLLGCEGRSGLLAQDGSPAARSREQLWLARAMPCTPSSESTLSAGGCPFPRAHVTPVSSHSVRRGLGLRIVPCSVPPGIPGGSARPQELAGSEIHRTTGCLCLPFLSSAEGGRTALPVRGPGCPVPLCLPRLRCGCSRRAGAVIPITGCSAVLLCALNSGCISPLRQLYFSAEE